MTSQPDRFAVVVEHAAAAVFALVDGGCTMFEDFPPAAVAPLVRGEPVESAYLAPQRLVDMVGSGVDWPPRRYKVDALGRLPASIAWPSLSGDLGRQQTMFGLDAPKALAAIVAGVLPRQPSRDWRPRVAVVVPNQLDLRGQDRLLRELRLRGIDATLLWRPVASALDWLEQHSSGFEGASLQHQLAQLIVLHVGAHGMELSVLDVVRYDHKGQTWILPARRRTSQHPVPGGAWGLRAALPKGVGDALAWYSMFGKRWAPDSLAATSGADLEAVPAWLMDLNTGPSPTEWFREALLQIEGQRAKIAPAWLIMSGEIAAEPAFSNLRRELSRIAETQLHCVIDATSAENRMDWIRNAARGAGLYLGRLDKGEPTYLDMLPAIETIVVRQGEPRWHSLVGDGQYVLGGIKMQFTHEQGFVLRRDSLRLQLTVAQEGFSTVRAVAREIGRQPTHDISVKLHVSLASGQGNPIVEVEPDDLGVFNGRRVQLDWDLAEDLKLTREVALEEEPRTCPPLLPRGSSNVCWLRTKVRMVRSIEALEKGHQATTLIDKLGDAIKDADSEARDRRTHATAFDSDGRIAIPSDLPQRFIDAAMDCLLTGREHPELRRKIIRCLGYMSSDDDRIRDYILDYLPALPELDTDDAQPVLVACGNCLRRAEDTADFLKQVEIRLTNDLHGSINWTKAMAQILAFRLYATQNVTSQQCQRLLELCYSIATNEYEAGNLKFVFRYSVIAIAMLLRHRVWDSGFLPPDGVLAVSIKVFFNRVIEDVEHGRIQTIGGVVDIAATLEQIIKYIDRKGHGTLEMPL